MKPSEKEFVMVRFNRVASVLLFALVAIVLAAASGCGNCCGGSRQPLLQRPGWIFPK